MWEWMAGSGRLSATARRLSLTHLPPLDYRWGHNLSHWFHQVHALWCLLLFPVNVLFASPTCTPWSTNARQWSPEKREALRGHEALTLRFLTICFFIQSLLGRSWMVEQPAGSDMFRASALSLLTGDDPLEPNFDFTFDQCMLGAHSENIPVKKRSTLLANRPFSSEPPQCDQSHQHCVLRGSDRFGVRTAQAAVYPPRLCSLLLDEISQTSDTITSGGRAAEINISQLKILSITRTPSKK